MRFFIHIHVGIWKGKSSIQLQCDHLSNNSLSALCICAICLRAVRPEETFTLSAQNLQLATKHFLCFQKLGLDILPDTSWKCYL